MYMVGTAEPVFLYLGKTYLTYLKHMLYIFLTTLVHSNNSQAFIRLLLAKGVKYIEIYWGTNIFFDALWWDLTMHH